jgi:hypothetical protein
MFSLTSVLNCNGIAMEVFFLFFFSLHFIINLTKLWLVWHYRTILKTCTLSMNINFICTHFETGTKSLSHACFFSCFFFIFTYNVHIFYIYFNYLCSDEKVILLKFESEVPKFSLSCFIFRFCFHFLVLIVKCTRRYLYRPNINKS